METENNIQDQELISEMTDYEIFTRIWTSPRKVFRYLNESSYDKFIYILLILAGITNAFDRASMRNMGDDLSLSLIILVCTIFGGLLGWMAIYIYSALLSWTGGWLSGKGNTQSILRTLSFAMIPSIASLIILPFQFIIFGNEIFKNGFDIFNYSTNAIVIYFIFSLVELTLGVWTMVLIVIGISEVQKFSIWNSIFNLILPALVFGLPLLTIALLVGLLT